MASLCHRCGCYAAVQLRLERSRWLMIDPLRLPVDSETNLVSFVLRFVSEHPLDEASTDTNAPSPLNWHGVIRHVQTNEERHFTRWSEAVSFISRYVNVSGDTIDPGKDSKPVTGM